MPNNETILNKNIVLAVNSAWQPIGITSVRAALGAMFSSTDGENMAAKALVVDYQELSDGAYDFDNPLGYRFVFIDEWLEQKVRPFDNFVRTPKMIIRVPTVIQAHNFSKMPKKQIRPTKRNLYDMYEGRCVWTGKKLSWNNATIEHMKPKSLGGEETWSNLAISDKNINNRRGNTPLEDFEYKPKYRLKEPKSVPASSLIKDIRHRDWRIFIS